MNAGLLTGRATAGEYGFLMPGTGFYSVTLEERDGKKGNVLNGPYRVDVDVQMAEIFFVNAVVFRLKMKEL